MKIYTVVYFFPYTVYIYIYILCGHCLLFIGSAVTAVGVAIPINQSLSTKNDLYQDRLWSFHYDWLELTHSSNRKTTSDQPRWMDSNQNASL